MNDFTPFSCTQPWQRYSAGNLNCAWALFVHLCFLHILSPGVVLTAKSIMMSLIQTLDRLISFSLPFIFGFFFFFFCRLGVQLAVIMTDHVCYCLNTWTTWPWWHTSPTPKSTPRSKHLLETLKLSHVLNANKS